jgi:hypothetical protein
MDIRMAISKANRITNPRLLAAMRDPRVARITEAVRRCDKGGNRREQLINGRYVWPPHVVALYDELKLFGATDAEIMAVGDALRDAAYLTVLVGTGAIKESFPRLLANDKAIEGEINQIAMRLQENPNSVAELQRLVLLLARERDATEHARLAALQRVSQLEQGGRVQ